MPGSSETPIQRLAPALAEAFGLRIITERRLVEALRMRCDPHAGTPFPAIASVRIAETDHSSEWNTLRLISTWDDLAAKLSEMMAIPLVAPPGKTGNFDFTLGWNPRDPDSLTRCLAGRGVTLEPGVEDLDVLVVRAR
ncbi:MAG TPA: hypothetical protein VMT52_07640 [Planctomycetota bacterium]|nr:hypothetical protein [Planctomycetota bacterium]